MKRVTFYFLAIFFSLLLKTSFAAEEPVSTGRFNNNAIGKHDVVSYHESKAATKGDKTYVFQWKGADWHFATQAHRDAFAENPERYAPAYNGFCSNALSLGKGLVRTNGKVWHIWKNRLHTFYAEGGRQRWLENDYEEVLAAADKEWQKELDKIK